MSKRVNLTTDDFTAKFVNLTEHEEWDGKSTGKFSITMEFDEGTPGAKRLLKQSHKLIRSEAKAAVLSDITTARLKLKVNQNSASELWMRPTPICQHQKSHMAIHAALKLALLLMKRVAAKVLLATSMPFKNI